MSRIHLTGDAILGAEQEYVGVVTVVDPKEVTIECQAGGSTIEWTVPQNEHTRQTKQGDLVTIRLQFRMHWQSVLKDAIEKGEPVDSQKLTIR